ncbi:MAG: hypothetical protein WCQ16_10530 [Verrucomicrobiae bacterium]
MNIRTLLLPVLLVALAPLLHASDSKRTADYLLITPTAFEGKEVTLDVSFVKPAHWKSPVPELAFFHALTMDRQDRKPGGEILVVVASETAAKFAKKYGTDFEGRNESNSLKGIFLSAPGGNHRGKAWLVDTTGKVADLIKQHKLLIEDDGGGLGAGGGGRPGGPGHPGPGPHHPFRPGLN